MAGSEDAGECVEAFVAEALRDLGLSELLSRHLSVVGSEQLPSCFPVTDLAAAAIGTAGLALADLMADTRKLAPVTVDRHLASAWFRASLKPIDWSPPAAWDAIAGDYRTTDGWIRLHTNAPRHREAALAVLACGPEREAVTRTVSRWHGTDLESAVVAAGGCAAEMRSLAAWRGHPQGHAVAREPLIALTRRGHCSASTWQPDTANPLAGIRVLDLTRVLAGPIATRFLAGLGADVLRIDPPDWDEPAVVPDVTIGKRCARLDLRSPPGRRRLEALLAESDILVHGYRPGALEALGLGESERFAINPGLIDVSLCAWGWTGPGRVGGGSTASCRWQRELRMPA